MPRAPNTKRCAFREGNRRCSRNGFGNPPLCRTHALQISLPSETPATSLFDLADRLFARSRDPIVQNARELMGELLAGHANAETAYRFRKLVAERAKQAQKAAAGGYSEHPPRAKPAPQPSAPPPPPPPPPPHPKEDPREVLGFPPEMTLTKDLIKTRQRELAKVFHPDRGGSVRSMQRVNDAVEALLAQISK